MNRVLIIDTSILCVYLQIPTFTSCGRANDLWDYNRINDKLTQESNSKTSFVLPLATIIETGNHISQASGDRFGLAKKLSDIIRACINDENPWTAFSQQGELWTDASLNSLADRWPELAARKISIGDATIVEVARYYSKAGQIEVEILTGDEGLKSFQPTTNAQIGTPRRRR